MSASLEETQAGRFLNAGRNEPHGKKGTSRQHTTRFKNSGLSCRSSKRLSGTLRRPNWRQPYPMQAESDTWLVPGELPSNSGISWVTPRLPVHDDQFDGVYCRFLLEHVADPKKVVSEMCRAARPGAWICTCEWELDCRVNYPESKAIEQVWRGIYSLQERVGGDPWIARKLYGILKNAGLTQVRVEARAWTTSADQKERM